MTPAAGRPPLFQRHWMWWFMVIVLGVVAFARLRLLNFPLERDEGEYAYAGQLILQGIPPYELAYNMKFPGTYLAYAAILAVFGQTPAGIHLGLLLLTTATALLLFWLGKKILDETAGVVAATSYVVLAISPAMLGIAGHATHFCAFFITAGFCLMWRARQQENLLTLVAGGLLFGTAVLMKQHAALIAAWAGLSFAGGKLFCSKAALGQRFAAVSAYGFAMLTPLALCCLWLWHAGVFAKFKFWTIDYASEYASVVPWQHVSIYFWHGFSRVITAGPLLWLLAAGGLILVWRDARWEKSRGWFLGFCAASALAVCPDFYFRPHYFLIALPALGLLAGATISGLRQIWGERSRTSPLRDWPAWAYALIVTATILAGANVWFRVPIQTLARQIYGGDPFPEAEIIADYINKNSPPSATLAILGSEPEIYFLSHRHSATGYIYTYAQMEPQPFALQMQREMIGDIEARRPLFIVFAQNQYSWNVREDSDRTIFHWWEQYQTNYTLVGLTDILSKDETIIALGTNYVARYGQAHGSALEIFQRK